MATITAYEAFATDLMALCAKHDIKIEAHDGGPTYVGPATHKGRHARFGKNEFADLTATPTEVILGDVDDEGEPYIRVTAREG